MIGAIIGDIVGSPFEFNNIKTKQFELITNKSCFTDDTVMTIAVADALLNGKDLSEQTVSSYLQKWGRKYPDAGYGGRFFNWVFSKDPKPYNSYGNGSAMRISSVGWLANSEEEVKRLSKAVTEVTHNHPEGLKGAEIVAMCIYYARIGKDKEFIRKYIEQYYNIDFDYEELKRTFFHGEETCQATVPQALYCFLISKDFEDCLRTTISIGGDCDTTAAISCAIAEAYYKEIPEELIDSLGEKLPQEMIDLIDQFLGKLQKEAGFAG